MNEIDNIISAPILLIAFNRPINTEVVFQKIRDAHPTKLYVTVDGPRFNKDGEKELVDKVKQIVLNVDWPCNVYYRFNERNIGAEITIVDSISWVLEKEDYVIILEDDIVAPISFFSFAQEMLEKYINEERIWAITGVNFTPITIEDNSDYFFAKYGHTWGWATWKRFWKYFDLNIDVQDEHLNIRFLRKITNSNKELKYYRNKFKRIKKNGVGNSTWDNIASYIHRTKNLLYIIPRVNLISNIGTYGLHAQERTKYHFTKYDEKFSVKKHPQSIECNTRYDIYHFDNYIIKGKSFYLKVIRKISRLIKNGNYKLL
ncbi:MAG: hemolysin hemolytic protein [Bacteroidales bacterium]|nr:hemolysin hemolytic protein [Bacteroidales bacterium]